MPQQWYYSKAGQKIGPVSAEKLKELAVQGQIAPTDLVWKEGMTQWAKAGRIKGLCPVPTGTQLPPPLPTTATSPIPKATPIPASAVATPMAEPLLADDSPLGFLDSQPRKPAPKKVHSPHPLPVAKSPNSLLLPLSKKLAWIVGGIVLLVILSNLSQKGGSPMTRDDFKQAVWGKTPEEVIKVLGKPGRTTDLGGWPSWTYYERTFDPLTGKIDSWVILNFERGRVDNILFS